MPTINLTTSQTPDRVAAYRRAAEAAGMYLSEWVAVACDEMLPPEVQQQLSDRPPRGPKPKNAHAHITE